MNTQVREWLDEFVKQTAAPCQVNEAQHLVTEAEINNICYLTMKQMGWHMRAADFMVVRMMMGRVTTIEDLRNSLRVLGEYIWDHLMGESDDISADDICEMAKALTTYLYTLDGNVRNDLGENPLL